MNVVVLNAGSSSLKLSLFRRSSPSELPRLDADWQAEEDVDWSSESAAEIESAVTRSLSAIWEGGLVGTKDDIGLVGHRVVHGGNVFLDPVIIDDEVTKRLETLAEFAPLHNPINVRLIQIARRVLPEARHAAVFDTAFHKTLPPEAFRYPVPNEWFEKFHIRKYGFHGINHKYCSHRAAELLQVNRIITCHLGGGCSLAAVMDGVSVETTMGFTPLDGLMMRSRSGSIDPGILFFLIQQKQAAPPDLEDALNKESGLKGIFGKSGDMKVIVDAMQNGNAQAQLAFDMFIHRVAAGVAAMCASMNGLDALVFTGGIGEHSHEVREAVCRRLQFLGVALEPHLSKEEAGDGKIISASHSAAKVLVLKAREDWQIVVEALRLP
jgi:acetate kinase